MQSEVIDPFHKWFLSLPESRREVLRQDKWGLADAAFNAGREAALSTDAEPVKTAPAVAVKADVGTIARIIDPGALPGTIGEASASAKAGKVISALSAQVQDVAGGAVTISAMEYAALRSALKPFAKYAGDPSHIKQRAFLQLLICPLGDEHPENHVPFFQAALAALAINPEADSLVQ